MLCMLVAEYTNTNNIRIYEYIVLVRMVGTRCRKKKITTNFRQDVCYMKKINVCWYTYEGGDAHNAIYLFTFEILHVWLEWKHFKSSLAGGKIVQMDVKCFIANVTLYEDTEQPNESSRVCWMDRNESVIDGLMISSWWFTFSQNSFRIWLRDAMPRVAFITESVYTRTKRIQQSARWSERGSNANFEFDWICNQMLPSSSLLPKDNLLLVLRRSLEIRCSGNSYS